MIWKAKNLAEEVLKPFLGIGKIYFVGGLVRDHLINRTDENPLKDIDIEIHNVSLEVIRKKLTEEGIKFSEVGKAFGVFKIKHNGCDIDISVPRRDSKVGSGHIGFEVEVDPFMGIDEALRRRDFTINAVAAQVWIDTSEPFGAEWVYKFHDPFGGQEDIKNKVLRMVDPDTFVDDPLRVLRGIQFASRFDLTVEEKTYEIMQKMV